MTYFSLSFLFHESTIRKSIVYDIYNAFFTNGFTFKKGCFESENKSLIEIIKKNQKLLEQKFKLGEDQNAEEGFIQIELQNVHYSSLRLYIIFGDDDPSSSIHNQQFEFVLLIPENEMISESNCFLGKKIIPLISLSEKIFITLEVAVVQSSMELSYPQFLYDMTEQRRLPDISPFSLLANDIYLRFEDQLNGFSVSDIPRGKLVFDESLIC